MSVLIGTTTHSTPMMGGTHTRCGLLYNPASATYDTAEYNCAVCTALNECAALDADAYFELDQRNLAILRVTGEAPAPVFPPDCIVISRSLLAQLPVEEALDRLHRVFFAMPSPAALAASDTAPATLLPIMDVQTEEAPA
jgi:hypothetical protein